MKHIFTLFFTLFSIHFLSAQCTSGTQVINEGGSSTPAGWTVDDQRTSYWLVTDDSGSGPVGEAVITSNIDVSAYGQITVNMDVATFGSGTAQPATIEYSTDGGSNYNPTVFTTNTPSSSSYIDGGDFVFMVPAATTQLVIRIGRSAGTGRDVRIRNLFVCGEAASNCPVTLTYNTPTCDAITLGTDTYSYTVDFVGAGQGAGTYLSSSMNGVISGDDPDLVASGTITVTGNSEGTDDLFELIDGADCTFSESITAPDCIPVCPLMISNLSVTCDVLTSGDDNYTYSYDFSGGGQGAGTYTLTSVGGVVGGDDPNLLATGVIMVTGNVESSGDLFEIASSECLISESITAPVCEPLPEIYINEFVADPNGSGFSLNTNHDFDSGGNPIEDGTDDEMVELIWLGNTALDLTGWTISDGNSVRHTFGNVQLTPSLQYAVVFGGGDVTYISSLIPDAYFTTASSNAIGLNNGGDVIELRDNNGTLIRSVAYGSATTFTHTNVSGYSDNVESSWGRNPDGTGDFVQSAAITPAETFFTPGESNTVQSALPVNYDYYNLSLVNTNQVLLSWATTQEINNERFDIQRSVNNGEFVTIGSISGQGSSNKKNEYKFLDQKTEVGMNYYRLRQLDFEGKSAYSQVKLARIERLVDIKVYPTLVNDRLSYDIGEEEAKLILMSIDGSVYKEMYISNRGDVDMTVYTPGMYTVTINTSSTSKTVRVTKI